MNVIDIAIECFEKSRRNRPLQPLNSMKQFEILYCGPATITTTSGGASSRPTRSTTAGGTTSPTHAAHPQSARGGRGKAKPVVVRRIHSTSPVKESIDPDAARVGKNELKSSSTSSYLNTNNWSQEIHKRESKNDTSELKRSVSRQKDYDVSDRELTSDSALLNSTLRTEPNKPSVSGKSDQKQTMKRRSTILKASPYNMAQVNLKLIPQTTSSSKFN